MRLCSSLMASLSRYRGCLVGAVLGDCIGAIYECEGNVKLKDVLKTVKDIEADKEKTVLQFTDDTAMARSVAVSLIQNKDLNIKDMAKRFADEHSREPNRGYGGSVGAVFEALHKGVEDVFEPARKQFDGEGSFGNGGAMRICPAALFCLKDDFEKLKDISIQISKITHSHVQAIQGAVLQSSAVDLALRVDPSQELDRERFLDRLIERMKPMEEEELKKQEEKESSRSPSPKRKPKRQSDTEEMPYCFKLRKIKEFLDKDVTVGTIEEVLGNDISALGSVPAAVYAFLKAYKPITDIPTESAFERTIIYAISLGGDTDTIATMAGAIAGAYYGYESIPLSWQASCEGVDDACQYAKDLLELQETTAETAL